MSKLDINFSDYKASGVYFIEIDNSIIETVDSTSGRLAVGFSKKGVFNAPVYLDNSSDLVEVYGDVDPKLERRGVFFNRSLSILVGNSPTYALNLLPVTADDITHLVKIGTVPAMENDVQVVSYASLYDKSRFWKASSEYLSNACVNEDGGHSAINFGNVGTTDFTLYVRKAENLSGYSVSVRDWYGTDENIPYSWMQPSDLISDYFIQVICVEGNWSDKKLTTDTMWSSYFELGVDGVTAVLKKDKINKFMKLDAVNVIGNYTGCVLPNFFNKMGQLVSIQDVINSRTLRTGLLMSVDEVGLETCADLDFTGRTAVDGAECKYMSYTFKYPETMTHDLDASVEGNSIMFYQDSSLIDMLSPNTVISVFGDASTTKTTRVIKKQKFGQDSSLVCVIKTYDALDATEATKIKIVPSISDCYSSLSPIFVGGFDIDKKVAHLFDESEGVTTIDGYSYYGEDVPIARIYSMLEDKGIKRGLMNNDLINFRYVIDTMGHGFGDELGSKKYLSRLAANKLSCLAFINAPSKGEFANNQYSAFYDEDDIYCTFDTKYIPMGGNDNLVKNVDFSLMGEENGSKHAAVFFPYLVYRSEGREIYVPPAADVANAYMTKFNGGDPYVIVANTNGILPNARVRGVEYQVDDIDREYLEPMGINSILWRNGKAMIYGDRTAYQDMVSDYNYIHVREILNTIEIESKAILQGYVFRYNNAQTRAEVTQKLTPILTSMKDSGALYKYTFQFDENNNPDSVIDRSFAIIDIGVWITKGMEKVVARITVNKLSED